MVWVIFAGLILQWERVQKTNLGNLWWMNVRMGVLNRWEMWENAINAITWCEDKVIAMFWARGDDLDLARQWPSNSHPSFFTTSPRIPSPCWGMILTFMSFKYLWRQEACELSLHDFIQASWLQDLIKEHGSSHCLYILSYDRLSWSFQWNMGYF